MFAKKELFLNIYREKKNIAKKFNQWVGLGYRLDHKLLFGLAVCNSNTYNKHILSEIKTSKIIINQYKKKHYMA